MREFMAITKALSDPNRVRMLLALRHGELCVCQITELFGYAPSTVSKHLGVLRNAGVVQDQKRGASVYYPLRIPCILNFFKCADAVIEAIQKEQIAQGE